MTSPEIPNQNKEPNLRELKKEAISEMKRTKNLDDEDSLKATLDNLIQQVENALEDGLPLEFGHDYKSVGSLLSLGLLIQFAKAGINGDTAKKIMAAVKLQKHKSAGGGVH